MLWPLRCHAPCDIYSHFNGHVDPILLEFLGCCIVEEKDSLKFGGCLSEMDLLLNKILCFLM